MKSTMRLTRQRGTSTRAMLFGLALSLSAVAAIHTASAGDQKKYPANSCKYAGGSSVDPFVVNAATSLYRSGSGPNYFEYAVCPVIRSHPTKNINSASITFHGSQSGCTFAAHAVAPSSSWYYWNPGSTTNISGYGQSDYYTQSWGGLNLAGLDSLSFSCSMIQGSEIFSYFVDEAT